MPFCKNCGNQIKDDAVFCDKCGTNTADGTSGAQAMTTHTVPKCTCCGHIGEMKPGPLLRGSDILWICLLMLLAGAGFVYLIFILIVRANPAKREKICPNCKSQNMITYVY